jgi:chromosome segregation ATPase
MKCFSSRSARFFTLSDLANLSWRANVSTVYVFELASYLFLAILFGIGIGWLIWGDEPFEASAAASGGGDEEALNDLSAQVETRDQEIVRLRKRLKRMHADLDSRDLQITEHKAVHGELEARLGQREEELSGLLQGGELPASVADVHVRRLSELEEELGASRAESAGLARKLQELIEAPVMSGQNPELEKHVAHLTQSNDELSQTHAQLTAAHEELRRSHAVISNDLAEAQARIDEVSSTADLAQHDRTRVLEGEIARLKSELAAAHEAHASLQSQSAASGGVEGSEIDLDLAKVQAELSHSRQTVSNLRQRLQTTEDENEKMAGDLARVSTELQSRSSKSTEALAERDRLLQTKAQVDQEMARLQTERAELEQRLQAAQSEAKSAASSVQALDDQLRKAHAAAADSEALRSQLAAARAEHDESVKQLHVELSDARMRADSSYDALDELNSEFISFREATIRQQTTMNSLADRLAKANSSLGARPTPQTTSNPANANPPVTPNAGNADNAGQ